MPIKDGLYIKKAFTIVASELTWRIPSFSANISFSLSNNWFHLGHFQNQSISILSKMIKMTSNDIRFD